MSSGKFSNDGSDVDVISNSVKKTCGLYEIDGVTPCLELEEHTGGTKLKVSIPSIEQSENYKTVGNVYFKNRKFLDAYDSYTNAIESCPGMTRKDILNLMNKCSEDEKEERRKEYKNEVGNKRNVRDHEEKMISRNTHKKVSVYSHEYGENLAIYHNNRAACLLHLERFNEALTDCNIALFLNPRYKKAMIRRMTAYEKMESVTEALIDAKNAYALDPYDMDTKKHVTRLEKLENERLERVKKETIGQLKTLGNNLLGNFGLSLDNFKAEQDPKTGSYNISFQQNK